MTHQQPDMLEFIKSECEEVGTDPKTFVRNWVKSGRNPCIICDRDKSKCRYYKELVAKGIISEEENSI